MPSSPPRLFVDAIRAWCERNAVAFEARADGWLVVMERDGVRRFALGYDIGLNSAIASRLATDKAAASEVLSLSGIECVPHRLFLSPKLGRHIAGASARTEMLGLLREHRDGIVVKPNEGTSGRFVFHARDEAELDDDVKAVFDSHLGLAISPFVDIAEEVRVILLDGVARAVYRKQRGPDWRHNLDHGARPILIEPGETRDARVALAIQAAEAIGIRFASVDIVRVGASWRVLEINAGVMMETLGKHDPELVYAIYADALEKVFASEKCRVG